MYVYIYIDMYTCIHVYMYMYTTSFRGLSEDAGHIQNLAKVES